MAEKFRVYDRNWNHVGYADEPQYAGQQASSEEFPDDCPTCSSPVLGYGQAWWFRITGKGPAKPTGDGNVGWCRNLHHINPQPVGTKFEGTEA